MKKSLWFYTGNGKTKDSELNSKHSPKLICFNFFVNLNLICYCCCKTF